MSSPDFNQDPEVHTLNELLWTENDNAAAFVLNMINSEDFYNPLYGQVFTAIKDSHTRGLGRDAVTVNKHLLDNHDSLGILNAHVVSRLLVNITVLDTPRFNLRNSAHEVLTNAYRRGFEDMAGSLAFAATEAPTEQLFDILLQHGTQQRAAAERLDSFTRNYNEASTTRAPEETEVQERIARQLARQGGRHAPSQQSQTSPSPLQSNDSALSL